MKKILLTGATDGIGLETAKLLAVQGHYLLIHGRSADKLKMAEQEIKAVNSEVQLESYRADLSQLQDVKRMLDQLTEDHSSLDVIINNAGVFKTPDPITDQGLDIRFVVNTFAPYLITKILLPLLVSDGRVVNLSSAAQAPVDLDAFVGKQRIPDAFQAYAQSKLAITIWSQELAKTLQPKQVMVAVNPGSLLASKMVKQGFGVAGNDLSIGANILVDAALSEGFSSASGKYFDNDSGQFAAAHAEASDQQKCSQIMAAIESMVAAYL